MSTVRSITTTLRMETAAFAEGAKKGQEIFRTLRSGLKSESEAMEALLQAQAGVTVSEYQKSLDQVTRLMDSHRARFKDNEEMMTQIAKTESAMRQKIYEQEMETRAEMLLRAAARNPVQGGFATGDFDPWRDVALSGGGGVGDVASSGGGGFGGDNPLAVLRIGAPIALAAAAFTSLAGVVDAFTTALDSENHSVVESLKKLPLGIGRLAEVIGGIVGIFDGPRAKAHAEFMAGLDRYGTDAEASDKALAAMRRSVMTPDEQRRYDIQADYDNAVKAATARRDAAWVNPAVSNSMMTDALSRYRDEMKAAEAQRDKRLADHDAAGSVAAAKQAAEESIREQKRVADASTRLNRQIEDARIAGMENEHEKRMKQLEVARDRELELYKDNAGLQAAVRQKYRVLMENENNRVIVETAKKEREANEKVAKEKAKLQQDLQGKLMSEYDSLMSKIDPEHAFNVQLAKLRGLGANDAQLDAARMIHDLKKQLEHQGGGQAQIVSRFMSMNPGPSKEDKQIRISEKQQELLLQIRDLLNKGISEGPVTAE